MVICYLFFDKPIIIKLSAIIHETCVTVARVSATVILLRKGITDNNTYRKSFLGLETRNKAFEYVPTYYLSLSLHDINNCSSHYKVESTKDYVEYIT